MSDKSYDVYLREEKHITYHSLGSEYTVARTSRRSSWDGIYSLLCSQHRSILFTGANGYLLWKFCGRRQRGLQSVTLGRVCVGCTVTPEWGWSQRRRRQHALRELTSANLSGNNHRSSALLDDEYNHNVVDIYDNAHSYVLNNSHKLSTV